MSRVIGGRVAVVALSMCALFVSGGAGSGQTGRSRIVLAVVKDADNRPLTTLSEDDFVVRESGQERDVLAVHLADYPIALLVDNGSAARADFETIRSAAARFVARIGGQRPVALATIGNPSTMMTSFDDDRGKVTAAIEALSVSDAAENGWLHAIAAAARTIQATGTPFSAVAVVAASDRTTPADMSGEWLTSILDSRAVVHAVARDSGAPRQQGVSTTPDVLRALCDQTRGQFAAIFSAASYPSAVDHLADRLSSEMMIEFIEPSGGVPSDDMKVGVRVPGARVTGLGVSR